MQRRVLAATSISYFVVILDTSIVNVALERIALSLSTDVSGLQWIVNAYTLAFASLLLTGGTLGDRWGARHIYMAGLAVFTLASALCGIAPTLEFLAAARILQGIGAAMLAPCSLTLLNHAYPDPGERACAIGVWAGYGGAALAAGPLVGGVLIYLLGWRGIFVVNVPIGLGGLYMTSRIDQQEVWPKGRHLDLTGQLAAIIALGVSVAVLIEGTALSWRSPLILGGIAVGVFAWVAFLSIEAFKSEPMLPLGFFRNGVFSGASVVGMTTTLTFFGLIFVLSLFFQQVRGYSPLLTGLAFLPLTAVVTAGNMVSGRWAKRHGARWPAMSGLALTAVGLVGLLLIGPAAHYWLTALPLLAVGFGSGLITPAVTAALMGTVEKDRAGIAAGVFNSARQTGAALGVSIFGALIGAFQPFEIGMRYVLWSAIAITLIALVWWMSATRSREEA